MVLRLVFCLTAMASLSGCLLTTGPGLFAATTAVIINTDKTPSDHAMSFATGLDCSTVEYTKGREYCVSNDNTATQADPIPYGPEGQNVAHAPYCYRTLGAVTCYNRPDPLASDQARLQ